MRAEGDVATLKLAATKFRLERAMMAGR
jgi:hypothetical protein